MLAQQNNITEAASALVQSINLEKLRYKLTRVNTPKMKQEEFNLAEQEYRRFLTLKKIYPKQEFVPNKLVDELWHAHILDTVS